MGGAATVHDRGGLRATLLAAAEEEVAERGTAGLSLRAIARRAGVSHAAPAHHFGDRAGLLTALAVDAFARLTAAMEESMAALPADAAPPARVQAAGMGYLGFALAHPGLFDVMWRPALLHDDDAALCSRRSDAFQLLLDTIAAAQSQGWAPGRDGHLLALLAWTSIHGLAVLWRDGSLADQSDGSGQEDVAAAVTGLLVSALGAAPPDEDRMPS